MAAYLENHLAVYLVELMGDEMAVMMVEHWEFCSVEYSVVL